MDLYILRHAIAVERGTPGFDDDSKRPLTPQGERKMVTAAGGMKVLELSFSLILSSPYVRARRTAEIVAATIGGTVKLDDNLAGDGNPRNLLRAIRRSAGNESSVLLVGHEPYLGKLISVLLTGTSRMHTTLRKGGICKLTVTDLSYDKCASLEWLLTPAQLRRLR
jgi:phosphohistidine phosphatase